MKKLKFVSAPNGDWVVIYEDNGDKIWEGHSLDGEAITAVGKHFNHDVGYYEFTDEDEIDGCTPDNFYDIVGIEIFK